MPAKKYSSTLSQEDANQKAYIDMQNNGQQYANEHAECNSNIIISVYNPFEKDYFLTFDWGVQEVLLLIIMKYHPVARLRIQEMSLTIMNRLKFIFLEDIIETLVLHLKIITGPRSTFYKIHSLCF